MHLISIFAKHIESLRLNSSSFWIMFTSRASLSLQELGCSSNFAYIMRYTEALFPFPAARRCQYDIVPASDFMQP